LSSENWNDLLAFTARQLAISIFWHRLQQKKLINAVPEDTVIYLHSAFFQITVRNLRPNAELSHLLTRLKSENIPLILLKGMVIANNVYKSIGLLEINDIAVLAPSDDLVRSVEILTIMDYKPGAPITNINLTFQVTPHLTDFFNENLKRIDIYSNITDFSENYSISPHGL
jgi:hypothetical protein